MNGTFYPYTSRADGHGPEADAATPEARPGELSLSSPRPVAAGLLLTAFLAIAVAFGIEVAERGGSEYVCTVADDPSGCAVVQR